MQCHAGTLGLVKGLVLSILVPLRHLRYVLHAYQSKSDFFTAVDLAVSNSVA